MSGEMKVFTCVDFEGHWPVGTAAIVVAKDEKEARGLLDSELRTRGLELGDATLVEISTSCPAVFILRDGNY